MIYQTQPIAVDTPPIYVSRPSETVPLVKMEAKPLWWLYLVDSAQILGALATTAVFVALWLALGAEKPRLVFVVEQPFDSVTFRPGPLVLTVSNVGQLLIHIGKVLIRYPHLCRATNESALPLAPSLGHVFASARQGGYAVDFNKDRVQAMHRWWWLWNCPNFQVSTRGVRCTV